MAIEMPADGRFVLNEIFLGRVYDVDGLDFSKIRNVLDLGANVGTFAIYVCSRAPQATLHCFEPSKVNFDRLHANLTTNNARRKRTNMRSRPSRERRRLIPAGRRLSTRWHQEMMAPPPSTANRLNASIWRGFSPLRRSTISISSRAILKASSAKLSMPAPMNCCYAWGRSPSNGITACPNWRQ